MIKSPVLTTGKAFPHRRRGEPRAFPADRQLPEEQADPEVLLVRVVGQVVLAEQAVPEVPEEQADPEVLLVRVVGQAVLAEN